MKLIIHIGNYKSGSTTIQSGLKNNYAQLLSSGILYPRAALIVCAHHNIPFSVRGQATGFITDNGCQSTQFYIDKIIEEAKLANVDTIIISSEEFMAFKESDIEHLKDFLKVFDEVKIIAYLRNQLDLIESAYKFNILWSATSETISFETFLNKNLTSDYHEYDKRLQPWFTVHTNTEVVIKNFHDEIRHGLLDNFFKEIKFYNKDLDSIEKVVNPSLSRVGTLVLRANNRKKLRPRDLLINKIKAMESDRVLNKKHKLYTLEQFNETANRFFDSNSNLYNLSGIDLNKSIEKIDKKLCLGEKYTDIDVLNLLENISSPLCQDSCHP